MRTSDRLRQEFLVTSLLAVVVVLLLSGSPAWSRDRLVSPAFRKEGKEVAVTRSIVVGPGQIYDGRLPDGSWTLFRSGSARMGDGSQREDQQPLFIVKPGGILQYVIIGKPAADGIHLEGSSGKKTTVRHVQFRDVGEDAITVSRSSSSKSKFLIDDCDFLAAADKVIQINVPSEVLIDNCYAQNFIRFARTSGTGRNYSYRVTVDDLRARDGGVVLKMTNSKARGEVTDSHLLRVRKVYETENGAKVTTRNIHRIDD